MLGMVVLCRKRNRHVDRYQTLEFHVLGRVRKVGEWRV